jgi:hypothetical protein
MSLRFAMVSGALFAAACAPPQDSPAALTPVAAPVGLAGDRGILAQLCAGDRPVPTVGLVRHSEPPLENADGGRVLGRPETTTLMDAAARETLDAMLGPSGLFCDGTRPRRESACGRGQSDIIPSKRKGNWHCITRRGCGEWSTDQELCVAKSSGSWWPRFASQSPGGDLIGRKAIAMRKRVAQARKAAAVWPSDATSHGY